MAWTAPRTWVTGEVVTSSIMNTHVRDNLIAISPTDQYGSSLPGSPVEGQPYWYKYLPEGIVWELRYSLDSSVQNGTLTSASASVTGLTDTSLLHVGMNVVGTNVPASTTIASITSATAITMSANASGSGTSSLTFTAKYPWKYVGGPPIVAERIAGNTSVTTYTTYKTLANMLAGVYFCEITQDTQGAPEEWYASIGFAGATAVDGDSARCIASNSWSPVRAYYKTTASGTMTFAYRKTDGTFEGVGGCRWLVLPVRVS